MNLRTKGDAERGRHALHCGTRSRRWPYGPLKSTKGQCWMSCSCWCHERVPNHESSPQ